MTAGPDIFLSYNREDQTRAKLFADAFAAAGLSVWWDTALRSGEAYDEVTEAALRAAKAVVVLWSPRSVVSRWVRAEATIADRCKTLVPVTIEPCERPIMFELTQTAELSQWSGSSDDRAWRALLSDVQRFVGLERTAPANLPALASVAAHAGPARETLLAVLPFDNLSSDAEMQYFSDGVSEDILGRIQRGSKLKVIGRTSSFQFRGADKAKAAAALKASHVLDGSIRRGGAKVRITASLTDVASQTSIWSDKYDRSLDDIFAVQDEISEAIASALDTAFFPAKQAEIDPVTYDLYLQAQYKIVESTPTTQLQGIALLEQVIELAPEFGDAWVSLAFALVATSTMMPYIARRPVTAKAKAALVRGLGRHSNIAEAAWANWFLAAPFGAQLAQEKIVQKLMETDPNSAMAQALLTYHLETVGRNREAANAGRQAHTLDPRNSFAGALHSQSLWRAGLFAEGIAAMAAHAEIFPDDHHTAAVRVLAYVRQGDRDQVDIMLDPGRLARYPLREHLGVAIIAQVARSTDPAIRRRVLDGLRSAHEQTGSIDHSFAALPAHFGFVDETYDVIDSSRLGPVDGPSDSLGGNAYRCHMLFAAAYPELRADPRFVKLCARLGLVEYWLATQKWPDCAEVVPYDFRAECEKYRDYPKDVFLA
jgi:TolB-like protein